MSKIEWTDETWNPIVGCSVTSPGCTNCYAMRMAGRLEAMGVAHYAGLTQKSRAGAVWTGKLAMAPDITAPLHWSKPRRVFVNSMGDLFHEDVPDEWIDQVFAIMALAPQHTFQVLTKRADRMRDYLSLRREDWVTKWAIAAQGMKPRTTRPDMHGQLLMRNYGPFPLPNVWLGVSVEDQERADRRIPDLLATPAAVRFLSCEPLLFKIDLTWIAEPDEDKDGVIDALLGCNWIERPGDDYFPMRPGHEGRRMGRWVVSSSDDIIANRKIDWVIVGGESGPKARPMHPDWARTLRDQCAAAGVPFFFKQWGEWMLARERHLHGYPPGKFVDHLDARGEFIRIGKKAAGRLLDGVEYNGFPATPAQEART